MELIYVNNKQVVCIIVSSFEHLLFQTCYYRLRYTDVVLDLEFIVSLGGGGKLGDKINHENS